MTANSITGYLTQLRSALAGSDKAILQDALSDAEEHLRSALEIAQTEQPDTPKAEALQVIMAEYGSPEEIAEAYREVETYTRSVLAPTKAHKSGNFLGRFFGIFIDLQAWGALIYLMIAMLTGILFLTWSLTGTILALVFALFIFGLPFAAFFVLSLRGIALIEGRVVEALLGIRMPRRTVFSPANMNWRQRLVAQLTDKQTWLTLVYLLLNWVFGTAYFSVFVTLFAFALTGLATPIFTIIGVPIMYNHGQQYLMPGALLPLTVLAGIILLTLTMHLAKLLGNLHGRYAKFMLVGE